MQSIQYQPGEKPLLISHCTQSIYKIVEFELLNESYSEIEIKKLKNALKNSLGKINKNLYTDLNYLKLLEKQCYL
jgi:hypothetical protein